MFIFVVAFLIKCPIWIPNCVTSRFCGNTFTTTADSFLINMYVFIGMQCISEADCTSHGWTLVGGGCNVHEVTHSVPDVFFLCCFLMLGTFTIAYFIRTFRQSPYFPSIVSTQSSLPIHCKYTKVISHPL